METSDTKGVRHLLLRELREIAARPVWLALFVPIPLALLVLVSWMLSAELPTELPIGVVDRDNTTLSRQAVRMVDATFEVEVTEHFASLSEANHAIVSGDIYAVIYVPEHFERDLFAERSPEIVSFFNNQFLSVGNIVANATSRALLTLSAGISERILVANGLTQEAARESLVPIPVQMTPLFNPTLSYAHYLLASLLPSLLQVFIPASVAISVAYDLRTRESAKLVVEKGGSLLGYFFGKIGLYVFSGLILTLFSEAIILGYFDAPFRGTLSFHILSALLFVLASSALGAAIGAFSRDTIGALGITAAITAPAFGFAGISFPRFSMNLFALVWGALIPLVPYLQLRTDQVQRGVDLSYSLPALAWLAALALAYGCLALWFIRSATQKPDPQEIAA